VVEFAIVAPVFFLLVFGMIEYGRMVMVQQVITNASREGARRAVLDGATSSEVKSKVNAYLESAGIKPSPEYTDVDPSPPTDAGYRQPVTVSVTIPFSEVSWMPTPMFLKNVELSAKTVMSRESIQ
jgi:Flp pilus assembly protein TadG